MTTGTSISVPGGPPRGRRGGRHPEGGFILVFVLLMFLGVSALAVGMMYNSQQGQVAAQNHKNRIRAFYASDGMRALLAQEVLDGNVKRYMDTLSLSNEIQGEVWEGLPGGDMGAFKAAARARPADRVETSPYLGHYWKGRNDYGVRWRGYVIPPVSGSYTFFLRADDRGEFYLSEDESPANLSPSPIAFAESWKFDWPKFGPAVSKSVTLKMGKRYYFELYGTQSVGGGFCQVGWRGPKYMTERPIPGKRLAPYGSRKESWDTATVGGRKVKYALKQAGTLVYTVNTEAILGGAGDTSTRAPLTQTLSLLGDNPAPPDTLWQRVIFYDFSTLGTPDFERRGLADLDGGTVTKGLVREKGLRYTTEDAAWFGLDSIGKPIRSATARFTCGVERWFVPNTAGNFLKTYDYAGGPADCTERAVPANPYRNFVIKDSLPFLRREDLGVNAYQFKRWAPPETEAAFSPLDGRGYGDEGLVDMGGVPRNFGFCMEIHTKFEHTSGMIFEFNGDDDVWLYINDSLVMDLGFVHASEYASVNLDDLPLTFGETYNLDFFYCERRSKGSSIDLITNLPVLQVADKPSSSWKRDYGNLD